MEPVINTSIPNGGIEWQPDFKASRNSEGLWTASHSFGCRASDLIRNIPNNGAPCQYDGFGFMSLDRCDVTRIKGDLATVTCHYTGVITYPEDEEENPDNYRSSLSVVTKNWSILVHPRYADIPEKEKEYLKLLIEGQLVLVEQTEDNMKLKHQNNANSSKPVYLTDEKAIECAEKILDGVVEYLQAEQVWRETTVSANPVPAAKLNHVGKISDPQTAPNVGDGRQWLYVGVNSEQEGKEVPVYTHTYEFRLSDSEGWDEDLYGINNDN